MTQSVYLDANIILNVWRCEKNAATGEDYSSGSKKILKEIIRGKLNGLLLSTTAMEIVHVIRAEAEVSQKMSPKFAIKKAESAIAELGARIAVPDTIVMAHAYKLLTTLFIDPFDAILVSAAIRDNADAIISRDKKLKKKASRFIPVLTPEELISSRKI